MLRGIAALITLAVLTPLFAAAAGVWSVMHRGSDVAMHAGRLWSTALLAVIGARARYLGVERAHATLPCVFVANHLSNADIWVLLAILPPATRFVAKQELRRVPLLGWAMEQAGFVFVDRRNRTRAIASLEAAAERVRAGRSVLLFPEGTRSRDGRLAPFKKGPFHLALRAGVPVVPIAIRGSDRVAPPGRVRVHPGTIEVEFLPAIDSRRFAPGDVEGLTREARAAIASRVDAVAPDAA